MNRWWRRGRFVLFPKCCFFLVGISFTATFTGFFCLSSFFFSFRLSRARAEVVSRTPVTYDLLMERIFDNFYLIASSNERKPPLWTSLNGQYHQIQGRFEVKFYLINEIWYELYFWFCWIGFCASFFISHNFFAQDTIFSI